MATSAEPKAIQKPSARTFAQSRLKISSETSEIEDALIRLARARAKNYYIAVILKLAGLDRLYISTAIWGFEPERELLTLGQMVVPNQAWIETTFSKRDLEAL